MRIHIPKNIRRHSFIYINLHRHTHVPTYKRFFRSKWYPFISVNNLQSLDSYVIDIANNHVGGWKYQKGVLFFEDISEVAFHKERNWQRWASLSQESSIIPSHWPFKVWTMSNQILYTNPIGEALWGSKLMKNERTSSTCPSRCYMW